jgi:hypothetical protein
MYEAHQVDSLKLVLNNFIGKDCVEAFYYKGLFLSFCQDSISVDSSIYYLERVKEKYPKDYQTNCILGGLYFINKKFIESGTCLNIAQEIYSSEEGNIQHFFYHHVARDVKYLNILRLYAFNLIELKQQKEALDYLSSGIKFGDIYTGLYWDRYKLKLSMGDTLGANIDKALYDKKFPNNSEDRNERFMSQGKRGYEPIFCK